MKETSVVKTIFNQIQNNIILKIIRLLVLTILFNQKANCLVPSIEENKKKKEIDKPKEKSKKSKAEDKQENKKGVKKAKEIKNKISKKDKYIFKKMKRGLDYKVAIIGYGGAHIPLIGVNELSSTKGLTYWDKNQKKIDKQTKGSIDMIGYNIKGILRFLIQLYTPYAYMGLDIGYSLFDNHLQTQLNSTKKAPTGLRQQRIYIGIPIFVNTFGDRDDLFMGLVPKVAFNIKGKYKFMNKVDPSSAKNVNLIDAGLGVEMYYEKLGIIVGTLFDIYFMPISKNKKYFLKHNYSENKGKDARLGTFASIGLTLGYNIQYFWRRP